MIGLAIALIAPIFSIIFACAILFLSIIAASIFYLLKRNTKSNFQFIPFLIPINILFGIVLGYFFLKIYTKFKKDKATIFISKLENYRKLAGHYPEKIQTTEMKTYFIEEYSIDSNLKHFEIIQDYDGWGWHKYNSETNQWEYED